MKSSEKISVKNNFITFFKVLIIILIILIGIFLFYRIFLSEKCDDYDCFASALRTCKQASWLKEDADSVWLIRILSPHERDSCNVKFKLLNLKKGTIDTEELIGKEMTCLVMKTETSFPPADMHQCTGILKENIQDILIKRMHDYLLRNIGQLKEEFKAI